MQTSMDDIQTAIAISQEINAATRSTLECMRVQHCLLYLQLRRIADALEDTNKVSRWGDRNPQSFIQKN